MKMMYQFVFVIIDRMVLVKQLKKVKTKLEKIIELWNVVNISV